MVASARTCAAKDSREVASAVAQQGHTLAVDGCQHELAQLSVGNRLQGHGVDNLNYEVVFPDVQAVLFGALEGHSRAHHLRYAVGVVGFHSEVLLYSLPLLLAMRLCSDAKHSQTGVAARVASFLLHHLIDT